MQRLNPQRIYALTKDTTDMDKIITVNPATENVIAEYDVTTSDQLRETLIKSRSTFAKWRNSGLANRCQLLRELSRILRSGKSRYGRLITTEMGKPIRDAEGEIERCSSLCDYFADNAGRYLEPEMTDAGFKKSYISFEPRGVIASIMPWNLPFWQVLRFAVPATTAGNVVVLKHSSVVPGCALALRDLFEEAGYPRGVFETVIGSGHLGEQLVQSDVDAVTATASVNTGTRIAEIAARNLKKCVLELGGSDPFIVLEDADLELASKNGARSRNVIAGQSCIAAKRFVVSEKIAAEFGRKLVERTKELVVGDPSDEKTDVGPLVRDDQRKILHGQVEDSIAAGARLLTGGDKPPRKGFFYLPTVLADVSKDMRVFKEETFGPVSPITSFKDDEQAVLCANDSEYGLGASIWTRDEQRAEKLAERLQCGMVFVNGIVRSDPRLPFGGVKKSGIGRELTKYGMLELINLKSIVFT